MIFKSMLQKQIKRKFIVDQQSYLLLNEKELRLESKALLAKEEINLVFYVYNKTNGFYKNNYLKRLRL